MWRDKTTGNCAHRLKIQSISKNLLGGVLIAGLTAPSLAQQVIPPNNPDQQRPPQELRQNQSDQNNRQPDEQANTGNANRPPRNPNGPGDRPGPRPDQPANLDVELQEIITRFQMEPADIAARELPDIGDPVAQLGKKLFFSKSLGGGFDSACVTCHHPGFGGADALSLSVGVNAVDPELLGPGREFLDGLPEVPRNAPTVFNLGFWDTGLFWDSRVESLGREEHSNGALSGIATPDSGFGIGDAEAGANLAVAQARFPVTSAAEMKTPEFESGSDNNAIREHLAARIGDYGIGEDELDVNEWLPEFQQAYGVTASAEELINFNAIAHALGEYERSMVFVDNAWNRYLAGDVTAMNNAQKQGAILFFTSVEDGGAGCGACHSGPLLSDGQHHAVAFPQFGPGKGDGNLDDFGRERVTGLAEDRYRFRTPSLLNIELTAPYGHAGTYETLGQVVRHYENPGRTINNFFTAQPCRLDQFADQESCAAVFPEAEANSRLALTKLRQEQQEGVSRLANPNLSQQEEQQLVAFMRGLTDSCAGNRDCLDPWVADPVQDNPDGQVLVGKNRLGEAL